MGRGESEIRAAWRRHVLCCGLDAGKSAIASVGRLPSCSVLKNDLRLRRCCVESHPPVYVGGGDSSACLV